MSDPYFPSLKDIMTAEHTLNDILVPTPLMKNRNLSDKYEELIETGRSSNGEIV